MPISPSNPNPYNTSPERGGGKGTGFIAFLLLTSIAVILVLNFKAEIKQWLEQTFPDTPKTEKPAAAHPVAPSPAEGKATTTPSTQVTIYLNEPGAPKPPSPHDTSVQKAKPKPRPANAPGTRRKVEEKEPDVIPLRQMPVWN